jgi:hypothetical protein
MFLTINSNFNLKNKIIFKYNIISVLNIYHLPVYLLYFQSRFGTKLLQMPLTLNFGILLQKKKIQIQFFLKKNNQFFQNLFFFKFLIKLFYLNIKPLIFGISSHLILQGIGFRIYINKIRQILAFKIGYSHKIYYKIPKNIWIHLFNRYSFLIFGGNLYLLKQTINKILQFKKSNSYTGKGIKLKITQLKLKQGKKQI